MAIYSYGHIYLWPYIVMALYKLWPYICHNYIGHIYSHCHGRYFLGTPVPIQSWPHIGTPINSYGHGRYFLGTTVPIQLWPHIVTAINSYGHGRYFLGTTVLFKVVKESMTALILPS